MTAAEWAQIKAVFDLAAELPAGPAREQFIATACQNNVDLLAEVSSLLAALSDAGDFIETPARGQSEALTSLAADPAFRAGTSIGPYRIVQVIGEGGMGMVYQAVRVDDLYRKLVALKVVRRGVCSGVALRRFETERGILAHLDHPNIAKLLDGGTTADSRPYFVMDFIPGTPIDAFCDHQRLSLPQRLKLFLTVCSAVQYAHRNFVVHRDIKPQNILVTAEGEVRLLDFGIAKLLDPDAESSTQTVSGIQMMTPEYASPEQLHNRPVSTASDTYSLGVLLYLLLTGHKPFVFQSRSVQEICEVIRDSEPRRPSVVVAGAGTGVPETAAARGLKPGKLARELTGDLDNILLMALRREPERRYTTVEQLAGDLERYLDGRPVTAREDTFPYRAAKFVRRHQGAVLAGSLAAFLLVAGTITTSWEAHVATRERERAERRFNDVRRVANSLLFDVHDAIRDLPGSIPARQLIVTRALELLSSLALDAGDDRALQREVAAALERVGDVQGPTQQAATSYRKALSVRESLAAEAPADADARRELLPNYGKLSDLLRTLGDAAGALHYSRKSLAVSEQLATVPGAVRQDRIRLAATCLDYGYNQGDVASCRKALAIFGELAAATPLDNRLLRVFSIAQDRTAELLAKSPAGKPEALQLRQTSLAVKTRLWKQEPANPDYGRLYAWGHLDLARLLQTAGESASAMDHYQQAVEAFEALLAQDPANVQFRHDLALGRAGLSPAPPAPSPAR